MKSHFSSKFFAGNRARLRKLCGSELAVLTANGLLQRGADSAYRFQQDASFWYLTGVDEPEIILVMDGSDEYLILPEQSEYQKVFDGTAQEKELVRRSGVTKIYGNVEGWQRLATRLKKTKRAATVAPPKAYVDIYGIYTNPARFVLVKKMRSCQKGLKIDNVAEELAGIRMIKQSEEVDAIQTAIDITALSLQDASEGNYKHEYELEAELTAGFRRRGAAGHAFEPIVAAGKRACTLHNVANEGAIAPSDLVVVDVGAEVEHYAADITRTFSFGRPTPRQTAVYEAVLEAQRFAISLIKPGMAFMDYRDRTDRFIGEKLRDLGLVDKADDKSIREYYPHSISHFLGLNVHDAGDYSRPMSPGMVLTVEPGIYIAGEGIGVRIEDDVLVTEKGVRVLSGKLPRRLS